jgi:hypothetical protein
MKCGGGDEAVISSNWTWTDGRGGGEGPWRALNVEEKGAEKKNHRGGARRLAGRNRGERGGDVGAGLGARLRRCGGGGGTKRRLARVVDGARRAAGLDVTRAQRADGRETDERVPGGAVAVCCHRASYSRPGPVAEYSFLNLFKTFNYPEFE